MNNQIFTKLSIIALGETGHGKSLFCKLFSKSNEFVSKKSPRSVTTEIKYVTFLRENKNTEIFLIDTPGSNDSRGDEMDKLNLQLTRDFILTQPRINCIIIVMSSKTQRLTNSLKTSIINICRTFPLPDFWNHVIVFWTNWYFQENELYEQAQQFCENDMMNEFRELSKDIEEKEHINIRQIGPNIILPMIYNEYNENSRNEEIKKKNLENTENNFDKIIDLVKEMKPLYETVYPPENFEELQEPKNGIKAGNDTKFKYNKIVKRKYKDFNQTDIIENNEKVGEYTIIMQEKESEWEYNQEKNKKIQYIMREFYDENGNQINKPIEINIEVKEVKHEIDIIKERREEANHKRRRIYLVDCLTYPGTNQRVEENRTFVEEIEEGETDWEEDTSFHEPNIKKYNKYKTISKFTENGQKIGETEKREIIDWKKIETIIEDNIPIKVSDNITRFIKKTTIKELTSKDAEQKIVSQNTEDIKIEKIDKEYDKVENLDNNNLGTIKFNCYNIKYINNVKDPNYKILNNENSYIFTYKQDEVLKTLKVTREGLDYEKSYYEIYYIDSRTPNIKNRTDYKIFTGTENLVNIITKIDRREIGKTDSKVKRQNYKQYYRIENGNEILVREEMDEKDYEEDIIYSAEYSEIESPMSNRIIDELKREKKYPISFIRNYYKDELNTLSKEKIKIGSERVEIRLEHYKNESIDTNNKDIKNIEEYDIEIIKTDETENSTMINQIYYTLTKVKDKELKAMKEIRDGLEYEKYYYEVYYIDSRNPTTKIPSDIRIFTDKEKLINGKIKIDRREIGIIGSKIKRQNYKQYYRIENEKEIFVREEMDGKAYEEEINYDPEYSEIEKPMNLSKINEQKIKNNYPINYIVNYYKDSTNTVKQNRIKIRSEKVEIKLTHCRDIHTINQDLIKIEEYDLEQIFIDNKLKKELPSKLNYKSYDEGIVEKREYQKKEENLKRMKSHLFWKNEHYFDIYKITEIKYANGKKDTFRSYIETVREDYG